MDRHYDYIVVCAGTAGSVVAGRLAEIQGTKVLLLEAGGDASLYPAIWDPNCINDLYGTPAIHWGYKSTPQRHMNDRIMDVWRAKVTGGCGAHNDMVYARGAPADFDGWAIEHGCTGWTYREVAPHFERVEARIRPTTTTCNDFGGAFIEACERLGHRYESNYDSGASMSGVSPLRSTIDERLRRVTSYQRYVHLDAGRPWNLDAVTGALVDRIEFDSGRHARAVCYSVGGASARATAGEEIVVSGGAINSPAILMRSGIGCADELRRLGVPVVVDLPGVGENLMDALIFQGIWSSRRPIIDQPANLGYAIVWANSNSAGQASSAAEMTRGRYLPGQSEEELQRFYSVTRDIMRLQSRGSVKLRSLDSSDAPVINMSFLSHPDDYAECVKGFELMRAIGNAAGLAPWRGEETKPGREVRTPGEIRAWILGNAATLNHPVGTCRMGAGAMAVVDPQLRVRGVTGLRVIDVSIMPCIPCAHTQGPALMIGDKGASMILGGRDRCAP